MNKVIVYANPVAPFQKVILIKDNIPSEVGVSIEDLPEAIFLTAAKHSIEEIEFRGNREYCLGLMHDLCKYDKYTDTIKIKYFGG